MREVDRGIDPAQGVIHEIAQRAGELDADRTRPDDHEGEKLAPPRGIVLYRGTLELVAASEAGLVRVSFRQPELTADPMDTAEIGTRQPVILIHGLHAGDPVIVRDRAHGDDDVVERDPTVRGHDHVAYQVDRAHLALHELESHRGGRVAEWIRDRMRRQLAGGDLIEERGKEVVVLPVDQCDLRFAWLEQALEPADQVQPTESTADDDDPLWVRHLGMVAKCSLQVRHRSCGPGTRDCHI